MLHTAQLQQDKRGIDLGVYSGHGRGYEAPISRPAARHNGDFNHWKIEIPLADFVDLKEVPVGNTRKDKSIDRIFLNMSRAVKESGRHA